MKKTQGWKIYLAVLLAVLIPVGALAQTTTVTVTRYHELLNAAQSSYITKIIVSGKIEVQATIKIERDIEIEGKDETATLDGGGSVQILQVIGGDLTVSGVTFTGGKADGKDVEEKRGGAIYVAAKDGDGGNATITNCTFTDNTAEWNGGAVNVEATGVIEGSTFEGNEANRGGGVFIVGGGTITDSTFEGNEASQDGGGAYIHGEGTITDSTFEENEAKYGGGVYIIWNGGTITDSIFTDNEAHASGGGAYIDGEGTITGSTFENNTAETSGGGIYVPGGKNSSLTIENTDFYDNTAPDGSAIHLKGTGEVIIQGTNYFEGNENGNQGYGIEAANDLVYDDGEIIKGRRPEPDPLPTAKAGPVEAGVNNASSRYVAICRLTVYRDVEASEKAGTLPSGTEVTVTHFSSGMAYIAGQGYVEMTGLARVQTQLVP